MTSSALEGHLLDTSIRRGAAGGPFLLPDLPAIPGRVIAGTVLAAGPGAGPSWVARRVAAHRAAGDRAGRRRCGPRGVRPPRPGVGGSCTSSAGCAGSRSALAAAADGSLVPLLDDGLSLSAAADAHAALETRGTVGKVVPARRG